MTSTTLRRGALLLALTAAPAAVFAQSTAPTPATNSPPAAPAPAASPPMTTTTTAMPATSGRRASQIIGANIVNEENRNVGEVHDLMVDTSGGATVAVLSVGGFLGIGERYIAIPLSDLRWSSERSRWMLPGATVDSLKARPAFTYPERP